MIKLCLDLPDRSTLCKSCIPLVLMPPIGDKSLLLAYDLHSLQGNGKLFICRDHQHLLVAICWLDLTRLSSSEFFVLASIQWNAKSLKSTAITAQPLHKALHRTWINGKDFNKKRVCFYTLLGHRKTILPCLADTASGKCSVGPIQVTIDIHAGCLLFDFWCKARISVIVSA